MNVTHGVIFLLMRMSVPPVHVQRHAMEVALLFEGELVGHLVPPLTTHTRFVEVLRPALGAVGLGIADCEVETELARHESVREAVVMARDSADGGKLLVAYIISGEAQASANVLRQHLLQRLPEWMVPNLFIELESWPMTPNGKIDRKALPVPEVMRSEAQ